METKNQTTTFTEFILLGFTMDPKINAALFVFFFIIYLVTVTGNSLLIFITITNPKLHKPMYFFLCILSLFDLCYSTTALPRLLADLFSTERIIPFAACVLQIHTILIVEGSECQLLVVMAYDRYIAICHPLRYHILMRWGNCYRLVALVFFITFMFCSVPRFFSKYTLCDNHINHFICEMLAFVKLFCEDVSVSEIKIFSISFLTLLLPLLLILLSYAFIIRSVLKLRSAGRSKAFSTCTSHLGVVALYFGTIMLMYLGPASMYSSDQEKYSSIFYIIVSPMLNPLIYSLNNREIKVTIKRLITKNESINKS